MRYNQQSTLETCNCPIKSNIKIKTKTKLNKIKTLKQIFGVLGTQITLLINIFFHFQCLEH